LLPGPLAAAASALSFASAGELFSGLSLLYSQRLLERQSGTAQYGAYVGVIAGAAALLQAALSAGAAGAPSPSSSSSSSAPAPAVSLPLAFAFAGLVPFAADVPPQARFSILGVPCTDKAFSYLAAAHALWSAGARRGLLAAAAGLAAGLLYRLDAFGVQRLRLPRWLCGGSGGGGGSGPPARVLVPPVLDPAAAGAGDDDFFFGAGGGGGGGGGGRGGGGAEQLQARPQMRQRR